MTASSRKGQLALAVTLADHATFDNYHPGANAPAVAALRGLDERAGHAFWLWGPPDVGKSHLLQALSAADERAVFLPAAQLAGMPPSVIDGFERFARVCIDDVHRFAGDGDWERALFNLYNAVAEGGGVTLVASRDNPRSVAFELPDLGSRLRSGAVYRLQPLDDDERVAALVLRADRRGVTLPEETARYLMTRERRDFGSLCALLDTLDLAVLATRRRLTIPFIKDVLAERDAGG